MVISYDFHIHSCLSPCGDNDMTPNNIIGMASILELDAIAVSDHNSALNLPAVCKLGQIQGILVVPAIEITTAEEVHVLSLFPSLQAALSMGEDLYDLLPNVPNDPEIFGDQLILDENDQVTGTVEKLLINATSLSIEKAFDKVRSYGGVPIPAHIDKSAYSVISNLGFIPPELKVRTVEVKNPPYPNSEDYQVITDSDAHALETMSAHESRTLETPGNTIAEVLASLC